MFELFANGAVITGWVVSASAWAIQIGLLVLAVLGQRKWQWRLMFTGEILVCAAAIGLCSYYNYAPGFSYFDDSIYTLLISVLFCVTLFVSWIFWMNRKKN